MSLPYHRRPDRLADLAKSPAALKHGFEFALRAADAFHAENVAYNEFWHGRGPEPRYGDFGIQHGWLREGEKAASKDCLDGEPAHYYPDRMPAGWFQSAWAGN